MVKKLTNLIFISTLFLSTNFCYSYGSYFDRFSHNIALTGRNVKVAANITKYATAIAGGLYGIKACKEAGKAISPLIPYKFSDIFLKLPFNLVTETPFKLMDFARCSVISSLLFGVAYSMHKLGL